MAVLNIANDFNPAPGGVTKEDSSYSAEALREMICAKLTSLKKGEVLFIDLDGIEAVAANFLEACFGGLVSYGHFTVSELKRTMQFRYEDLDMCFYADKAWFFIEGSKFNSKG